MSDPNRPRSSSSTASTLGWIGCGCGALVAAVLAVIVGLTWFGYRKGKEIEKTFKDPVARTAATRKILQWKELPEGYYPGGAVSIPMLMEMAILSDEEPGPEEAGHGRQFDKRGLIFMSFNSWISDEQELLRWMRGETREPPKWLGKSDAKIDPAKVLKRGTVEAGGQTVAYVVTRDTVNAVPEPPEPPAPPESGTGGAAEKDLPAETETPAAGPAPETTDQSEVEVSVGVDVGREEHRRRRESLMTFFTFDCPGDNRARLGIWFTPDPAPGAPNAEVDLTGTAGDPEKIQEFVGHFAPCG